MRRKELARSRRSTNHSRSKVKMTDGEKWFTVFRSWFGRCRVHWDAEAGVPVTSAGKFVVWDDGRRLLVPKDGECKPVVIESRQTEVAMKSMTQRGHWVCFWA